MLFACWKIPSPPSLRFLLYEGGGDVPETIETRARRRHKRARIITFASLVALQLPFFQAWSAFPFSPVTVIPGHILLLLYHYSLAAPPFFLLLQSGLKKKKSGFSCFRWPRISVYFFRKRSVVLKVWDFLCVNRFVGLFFFQLFVSVRGWQFVIWKMVGWN